MAWGKRIFPQNHKVTDSFNKKCLYPNALDWELVLVPPSFFATFKM